MRRIWAIAQKEFIHIIRDPRLLMVIVAMPLIQMFLYSYALSFDVKNLPTATLDFDRTTQSRQYLDALQQSNYFDVTKTLNSYSEVDNAFESNAPPLKDKATRVKHSIAWLAVQSLLTLVFGLTFASIA